MCLLKWLKLFINKVPVPSLFSDWKSPVKKISSLERKWKKVKSLSHVSVWLFATPWTVAYQGSPSMGFPRQEYWSGLPFPSPGDLSNPVIKPRSPASPHWWVNFFTIAPPIVDFSATKKERTNYCCVTTGMNLKTLMLHERIQIPKTKCCHVHVYTILEKTRL